jgi:hypothetical protein
MESLSFSFSNAKFELYKEVTFEFEIEEECFTIFDDLDFGEEILAFDLAIKEGLIYFKYLDCLHYEK